MKRLLEWILYNIFPRLYWRYWINSREDDMCSEWAADAALDDYAMEFLMKGDPAFTYVEARKMVNELYAIDYMYEIEEVFETLEV